LVAEHFDDVCTDCRCEHRVEVTGRRVGRTVEIVEGATGETKLIFGVTNRLVLDVWSSHYRRAIRARAR
jgi:hypothetical protein